MIGMALMNESNDYGEKRTKYLSVFRPMII
jgi:hypothetical protein